MNQKENRKPLDLESISSDSSKKPLIKYKNQTMIEVEKSFPKSRFIDILKETEISYIVTSPAPEYNSEIDLRYEIDHDDQELMNDLYYRTLRHIVNNSPVEGYDLDDDNVYTFSLCPSFLRFH